MKNRKRLIVLSLTRILYIFILVITCSLLNANLTVNAKNANDYYVCLGGESIGLNIKTGVNVIGKYDVQTKNGKVNPWKSIDIQKNDTIITIDNIQIDTIEDLQKVVTEEKEYQIEYLRNGQIKQAKVTAVKNKNGYITIGLYVKDNVLGVGTLTFYDLKTKKYAALGHNACDKKISGTIHNSYIQGVTKGLRGIPGEKRATLDSKIIGTIDLNNEVGIFGTLYEINKDNELITLGNISDAHLGYATITTVIEGDKKETFTINIIDVENQVEEAVKGIKYEVTDKRLIEKTGGIIQGMSGSPIVQDGKLIGAVSHVVVEDSKVGYGVFAQFMNNYINS